MVWRAKCINNKGFEGRLEIGGIYELAYPPEDGQFHRLVEDESGRKIVMYDPDRFEIWECAGSGR